MTSRTVFLVRNGKVEQPDNQRRYVGQIDWPLSEAGREQSRILQKLLKKTDIETAYSSDLARSRQTAKIITENKDMNITALKDFREIAMGEWEGRSFAEIAHRFPGEFRARALDIAYYCTPGGESFSECGQRVLKMFRAILAKTTGNVLIVGHAGTNRVLLCHVLGLPLGNLLRIEQSYGCLNIIQCTRAGYQLKLMNYTGG